MMCLTACGVQQASAPLGSDETRSGIEGGYWEADYKETFDYKPLYADASPYSAVGENLIKNPGFDGASVQKGGSGVGIWVASGAFDSAYTISPNEGVDGSPCLLYNRMQEGKSQSYASLTVDVEADTVYVLTAKLRSANMSNPMIRVIGVQDDSFLSETAAGADEDFQETALHFYSGSNTQIKIQFVGNAYVTNFRETVSGKSYLDDLALYKASGSDSERIPHNYRLDDSDYRYSGKKSWTAWKWGLSEAYWYGNARAFSYNAVAQVYSPDSSYFHVEGYPKAGTVGYFGIEYFWEHKLKKNNAYQFVVEFPYAGETPDIVTVNDNIVWTQTNDGLTDFGGKKTLTFEYAATEDGYARIRFICETGIERGESKNCGRRMLFPPYGDWTEQSMTCSSTEILKSPDYVKFDLHKDTEFIGCDPEETALMLRPTIDASIEGDEIAGLPKVNYKVSDMIIYDELMPSYSGATDVLKRFNTDTLCYSASTKRNNTNFEKWAKDAIDAGITHLGLYTVMPLSYTQQGAAEGEYNFTQVVNMLGSPEELEMGITATTDIANRWLELVPDGTVSIILCELESHFGFWSNGIENANLAYFPGYESMQQGGVEAYRKAEAFLRDFVARCDAKITDPDKITYVDNSSRGSFDLTRLARGGADVVMGKPTSRCNMNIVMAIARGAGVSYDKPYGVAWDPFDRDYWYGISNDALRQGWLSMFHAGADVILSEVPTQNHTAETLTVQGKAWYDGVRYVRTHPDVGTPIVNTGIIRGEGDQWMRLAAKSSAWEQNDGFYSIEMLNQISLKNVLTKWAAAAKVYRAGGVIKATDTYVGDFGLLDVIFSNFGTATRTDMQRMLTGTPYGPANIMDDGISLEEMCKYDTLIYMGRGQTISEDRVKNLEAYVKQGGTLMIAAGQLKDAEGKLVVDSFAGVKLTKSKIVDGLPYTYIESSDAKMIKRHKNGDPQALMANYGEGRVAFFSGEYLSAYDNEVVRETMQAILDESKDVTFSKDATYIEYTPNRKGKSVVLPFINNGRGFFPSGNGKDYGVWTGNVAVNLDDYGLKADEVEIYRVDQSVDGTKAVSLKPVKFKTEDNTVVFALNIALIDEIVIGPKGQAEKDFFN